MRRQSALGWAAIDLCTCLILVIYTLIAPITKVKVVTIPTQGVYAVTQTCPAKSQNDVDIYVRDPAGKTAWYGGETAGLMHLEQDVIPGFNTVEAGTTLPLGDNERVILRGTIPGTYTVDLHMYDGSYSPLPETCTVALYNMQHGVNQIVTQSVTLDRNGSIATAFEFVVNKAGKVSAIEHYNSNIVTGN